MRALISHFLFLSKKKNSLRTLLKKKIVSSSLTLFLRQIFAQLESKQKILILWKLLTHAMWGRILNRLLAGKWLLLNMFYLNTFVNMFYFVSSWLCGVYCIWQNSINKFNIEFVYTTHNKIHKKIFLLQKKPQYI